MLYEYSNLYFPICSVVVSLLITILFFSKQNVKNKETKLYSKIVIITLIEALFTFGLTLSVHLFFSDSTLTIFAIVNKMLYVIYIIWISLLFMYFAKISNMKKEYIKAFQIFALILNIVLILTIFLSRIDLVYLVEDKVSNSYGPASIILYIGCAIYISFMVLISLITLRLQNNKKKYIPLIVLVIMMMVAMGIRLIDPYCNMLSNVISLIALIMYFTIENPDAKLMKELELAKNQAEKSNRAKSDFLSSMSHEIRTPLNAIVGLSELIQTNDNIEEIHEDAKDVVSASKNLLEIVNGILDISKIESNKIDLVNVEYKSNELFNDLIKLTNMRIENKEIELRTNIAEDIPTTLYGDVNKVKQILSNILINAVKYTEKGYIDFNIKCITEKENCKLIFNVKDTGKGIKKEQMESLFEKFYRAEEDRNSTIEGTGLGLAIAKSLSEMLGGNITVKSEYGSGSEFIITLNQKLSRDEQTQTKEEIKEIKYNDKKVLIVDDNKLNIKVAEKKLKEYEFIIDSVDSGFKCIDKIKNKEEYDLIFMDIMMPDMSGVDTLKKLKEIDGFNIPVVALTADAMVGQSTKYKDVGFNDYLSKPLNSNELNRVLEEIFKNEEKDLQEETKENKDVHKVIQITDEEIEELNKILAERQREYSHNNLDYLKENDIDVDSALELVGDLETYNETLKLFLEENKDLLNRLEKYIEETDLENYSILVHSLKSSSKYVGFTKLSNIALEHEQKSKENDLVYVNKNYRELKIEYKKMIEIINNYL